MITYKLSEYRNYIARTADNVALADVTIIFSADFSSPGTRLTKKEAICRGKPYIEIDITSLADVYSAANKIINLLSSTEAKTINVAGNAATTLQRFYSQERLDEYVAKVFAEVIKKYNGIVLVRSGGQTGADEAEIKAADSLGIDAEILAPAGWRFRLADGNDIYDERLFKERFER